MGKTLRQLHFEIQHIMDLSIQELETTPKEELKEFLKELKWNCRYVIAEKKRHTYSNNIQANAERRIIDIEMQMENISEVLNKEEITKDKDNIKKTSHPFVDDKTLSIFNNIMEKWDYDKDIKYAYIFNELMPENHPPSEYEKYIRENYNKLIVKFNYNNANSKKVKQRLREIIRSK